MYEITHLFMSRTLLRARSSQKHHWELDPVKNISLISLGGWNNEGKRRNDIWKRVVTTEI